MAIAILIVCGLLYIRIEKEKETFREKSLLKGFALMLICFGIAESFYYLASFQIEVVNIGGLYYGNYSSVSSSYEFFTQYQYVIVGIGFGCFFLGFEFSTRKSYFVLSAMQFTLVIILILAPYELALLLYNNFFFIIGAITATVILFLLARWSPLEFKAISVFLLLGILFVVVASIFTLPEVKAHNKPFFLYLPPIITILGALLSILPTVVDSKFFSKSISFWITVAVLLVGFLGIMVIIMIQYSFPIHFTGEVVIFDIVLFVMFFHMIKNIKKELRIESFARITNLRIPIEGKNDINVLEMFTKPKRLTEQEVTLHKEKKICLVCKGKVLRFNSFICECDALYCEKCARTLSDMENFCWVCGVALDESKPVKEPEEEAKEVVFEKDIQKSK